MEKLFVTVLRVSDPPPRRHKASLLACGSQGGHSLNVHLSLGHMSVQLQRAQQKKEAAPEKCKMWIPWCEPGKQSQRVLAVSPWPCLTPPARLDGT